jgi:hypothetical protein
MECRNRDAFIGEFVTDAVYSHTSAAEYDAAAALLYRVSRISRFHRTVHHPEVMVHAVHADFLRADFDFSRVGLEITNQFCDIIIEGRAKENCLAILRTASQNILHRLHEAHVGHAVSLVEDDHRYIVEEHRTLLD